MYFVGTPQIRWPREIFETHSIPAKTRDFLISVGLPECFEWPMFDFGIYDSDSSDLVIGESGDQPILIEATTGIVWFESEQPPIRILFNSSAELLSRYLQLVFEFQHVPDDDASLSQALMRMRSEMMALDPAAIGPAETCVWTRWLDEWEAGL
nr:SUKH-4 family immunity protein [Prosthecobacter vanneervenii]